MRKTVLILCFTAVAGLSVSGQSFNVVTVAGTDTVRDGMPATTSLLRGPVATAMDSAGNLYIADRKGNRVRKVSTQGVITTVAGNGIPGFSGDGSPASQARLYEPSGVVLDKSGNLYIADNMNNRIRKVAAATGIITTFAGNGSFQAAGDGGPATGAAFDPSNIALDSAGNLYIADYSNDRVWKVTVATGIIKVIAGTGITGYTGDNGPATGATLDGPNALAVDNTGNVYVCDQYNSVVRKISPDGTITTVVGSGDYGDEGDNGPAKLATLFIPDSIALDAAATKLYLLNLDRVRVVDLATNIITAFASNGTLGFAGDGGVALTARFYMPVGINVSATNDVYVADLGNYRVRRIRNGIVDSVAGTDVNDGAAATSALLNAPEGLVITSTGDVIISDTGSNRIRRVSAVDGHISTIAGTGNPGTLSGRIFGPSGATLDAAGNIVFADYNNNRVQRLTPQGIMSTIAGSAKGSAGFSGDGGFANSALLNSPTCVTYDSTGNLYITDQGNLRVRKVDAASGLISTVAGNGRAGVSGIGGPAISASMIPACSALDGAGNLYIADFTHRVLKVGASTGVITIAAGTGAAGFSGDGKLATAAQLNAPSAVAFDHFGNLYIADFGNFAIRMVTPSGIMNTIAGSGNGLMDRESASAMTAGMSPFGIAVSSAGDIYFTDPVNDRVRKLLPLIVRNFSIVGGNNQTGNSGAKITLSVKAADDSGNGGAGVPVTFAVTIGGATLSPTSTMTGADGIASTTVTLGEQAGPVVVTASSAGFPALIFNLSVNVVVTPVPAIAKGGVVGAALAPGKRTLAVGGIASAFGQNFAPTGTAQKVGSGDLVGGRVPETLAGVCVQVGQVRAPVFAVYPGQVNFQVPNVATGGAVPVRVVTGCGGTSEMSSDPESVSILAAAPEFFSFRASTDGHNPVAAVNAITGAFLGGPELGPAFVPARPMDVVTIFGTSFGLTNPVVLPGEFPAGAASVTGPVKVTIGGAEFPAGNILYVGVTPGNPGLFQLNLTLPNGMPDGDLPVVLTIGGVASPTGAYLTIRASQ